MLQCSPQAIIALGQNRFQCRSVWVHLRVFCHHQWIAVFLPTEIAHDNFLVGYFFHVVWVDRYLPAAAWGIDHELRDRIAGRVAPKTANDFDALAWIGPQMGAPSD